MTPELVAEIRSGLEILAAPGDVFEVRAPRAGRHRTLSGYFDDHVLAARELAKWDGEAPGLYFTINPVRTALLSRAANRVKPYAEVTTSDGEIVRRRRLLVDVDPVRPAGIASTDAEHEAALDRALAIRAGLGELGWPEPVRLDSGNGSYLIYGLDLSNDVASTALVKGALEALAFLYDDLTVKIDTGVFNAGRIARVPATMNCKGDSTPDRPHRRARILEAPAELVPVTAEQLHRLAGLVPERADEERRSNGGAALDLDGFIARHGLEVLSDRPWRDGIRLVRLERCPFNGEHVGGSAAILVFPSGAFAFRCQHDSCHGRRWRDLRELLEPGCYSQRDAGSARTSFEDLSGERAPDQEADGDDEKRSREPVLVCMADVAPEDVRWLWEPYLPVGKLTLLEGDPGLGKTWLALAIAAAVSKGHPLPAGPDGVPRGSREPANVLYLTAEDGLGDTLRPRLDAAEADVTRIHVLDGLRGEDGTRAEVTLADLDVIEAALVAVRPALVVVDPIQGYLGARVDMHRANEVRPVMAGMARLAEQYTCAVVAIRHLRKSAADRVIHRGLGSIDFSAAVRSILLVAEEPWSDEQEKDQSRPRRILAHAKSNLAPAGASLAFEIVDGRFLWAGGSDLRAEDLLAGRDGDGGPRPREAAEDFLEETLDAGPVEVEKLKAEAKEAGLSWRTVERAKAKLGIRALRRGFGPGGTWLWEFRSPDAHRPPAPPKRESGGLCSDTRGEHASPPERAPDGGLWSHPPDEVEV